MLRQRLRWVCLPHVPRVSRATTSWCDGGYISHVTSGIAVRRPPRVHSPPDRNSNGRQVASLEASGRVHTICNLFDAFVRTQGLRQCIRRQDDAAPQERHRAWRRLLQRPPCEAKAPTHPRKGALRVSASYVCFCAWQEH